MKKVTYLLGIAIVLFSVACTSTKESGIVKRKYNKGFYIAKNHKLKKQTKQTEVAAKENFHKTISTIVTNYVEKTEVATNQDISVNALETKAKPTSINSTTKNNATKPVIATSTVKTNNSLIVASTSKAVAPTKKAQVLKIENKKNKKAQGSADTNKIVLIILCLFPFIALIAMWLHDGKSITLNFWINLLLHLTFVLWLVFGILVVLDIINLA